MFFLIFYVMVSLVSFVGTFVLVDKDEKTGEFILFGVLMGLTVIFSWVNILAFILKMGERVMVATK